MDQLPVDVPLKQKVVQAVYKDTLDRFLKRKDGKKSNVKEIQLKEFDKKGYYARAKETNKKKVLEFGRIKVNEWTSIKSFATAIVNEDKEALKEIAKNLLQEE